MHKILNPYSPGSDAANDASHESPRHVEDQPVGPIAQQKRKTIIVEHLDPELDTWQAVEYSAIAHECRDHGCDFTLTGVRQDLEMPSSYRLEMADKISSARVESSFPDHAARSRVCLLDPKAEKDLAPEDGEEFDGFLFGGILGDDPPRDRTSYLRKLGFPGRRLGPKQMTTDTAARVARMVIVDGKHLDEITYVDAPSLEIRLHEVVEMPFRYVADETGNPILPQGMLELLAQDADKGILDLL